jgi:hypothetical protein
MKKNNKRPDDPKETSLLRGRYLFNALFFTLTLVITSLIMISCSAVEAKYPEIQTRIESSLHWNGKTFQNTDPLPDAPLG